MAPAVREHLFRSWADFLAVADSTTNKHVDQGWCNADNYRAVLTLARRGWPEGMAHVHAVALPRVAALVSATADGAAWQWDVTGANYEVGEYLSGVPECWLAPDPIETKPVIRVNVNLAAAGFIEPETLIGRGAAVMALALALQSAGYAVDLGACYQTDVEHVGQCAIRVPLIDADGGAADLDRLAFMLIHPAGYRALMMAVIRKVNGASTSADLGLWDDGLPWPADLEVRRLSMARKGTFETPDHAAAWVRAEYARLTAPR